MKSDTYERQAAINPITNKKSINIDFPKDPMINLKSNQLLFSLEQTGDLMNILSDIISIARDTQYRCRLI